MSVDKYETFSLRINEGENKITPSKILDGLTGTSLITMTFCPNEDYTGISISSKCSELVNKKLVQINDGKFVGMLWVSPSGNNKRFKLSADVSEGSSEAKISIVDFDMVQDSGSVNYLGTEKVIIQSNSNLGKVIRSPYIKGDFYEEGSEEMTVPRSVFDKLKKDVESSIAKIKKSNVDKEGFVSFNPDDEITITGHFLGEKKTRVNSKQLGEIKFQFTKNKN